MHTAIDDRTRLAYSEILPNEKGATAAAFWSRAHAWFTAHGITVQRAMTDNGSCQESRLWRTALDHTRVVHRTASCPRRSGRSSSVSACS